MKHLIVILFLTIAGFTTFAQSKTALDLSVNKNLVEPGTAKIELKVFPNPTKSQKVTIQMPSDEISEIQLMSIVGKEVIQKKLESGIHLYELNLQGIPDGVYLIQVKTPENKAVVKKLLISTD